MYSTKVLVFIKELLDTKKNFCLLCLTMEKDRKLVNTNKLQVFLKSIDKESSWFFKYVEKLRICYLCEGKVSRALAVVAALKNSQQLLSLYDSLRTDQSLNSTLYYLDRHKIGDARNKLLKSQISAVQRCEEKLPAMRDFCNVAVTNTLTVDTNLDRREKKNSPPEELLEISNAQVNKYLERARLDKNVTILENNDDLVIIENDISTNRDDVPSRDAEEDMVVIEDDSHEDSDSDEPARYESSTYVHDTVQTPEQTRDKASSYDLRRLRRRKIACGLGERSTSSTDSDTTQSENRERRRKRLSRRDMKAVEIPAVNPPKLVPLEKLQTPNQSLPVLIHPIFPDSPMVPAQVAAPSTPMQFLPVNNTNQDFALHPIIHGPDGLMYIPSLNCKVVDGKLEHFPSGMMPPLVNQNVIITNRAPEGSTIVYLTPNEGDSTQPVANASILPQPNNAGGSKLVIENGKVSYVSASPPPLTACAIVPMGGRGGGGAPPQPSPMATLRPTHGATLTQLEDLMDHTMPNSSKENDTSNAALTTAAAELLSNEIVRSMLMDRATTEPVGGGQPVKKLSNIGINRVSTAGAAAPPLRAIAPAPPQPVMKKTVDWEAKIPMEVITYIDAVEPKTKKDVPSPIYRDITQRHNSRVEPNVLPNDRNKIYSVIEID